jgi:3-oxoadipate CoA-transferase beta subunit
MGGAMGLAIGARRSLVMREHTTKGGEPKLVVRCAYPRTGLACVSRIYTDPAVIDVTAAGLRVIERAPGLSFDELQALTAAPLLP